MKRMEGSEQRDKIRIAEATERFPMKHLYHLTTEARNIKNT